MVNTTFICEDDAGKKIVDSTRFRELLTQNHVNLISPIYNVKGKGNLTHDNVSGLVNKSIDNGADFIFFLVDLDDDSCITKTKESLIKHSNCKIIVCKKAIESWFLADSESLSGLLKRKIFYEFPEIPLIPFDIINQMHKEAFNGRGISKAILPIKLIDLGFSLDNAAKHPNCHSAQYFVQKIRAVSNPSVNSLML